MLSLERAFCEVYFKKKKTNKCVFFKFSVTVGGIGRTDCQWVMFVVLLIEGGKRRK